MDAAVPGPSFAERTTLRVGGAAQEWVVARGEDDLVAAVRAADDAGRSALIVGGGSNLLVADAGFAGVAIEVATRGVAATAGRGQVDVRVAAGQAWSDVVDLAVGRGWTGIEAMTGIPGRVGATPVQNVGAYGQDISAVLRSVRVLDRSAAQVCELGADECGFGYRTSRFKAEPDRWVVLSVDLRLGVGGRSPVRYAQLADALAVAVGDEEDVAAIAATVRRLRAGKAMILDPDDHDSWSAGSFFTNPIVDAGTADRVPAACPRYPAPSGVKLSAAWLIEHSGMGPGFALPGPGRAAISSRHTLALTNRGGATAAEIVDLARAVRARVAARFAIVLDVEPRLVGCPL